MSRVRNIGNAGKQAYMMGDAGIGRYSEAFGDIGGILAIEKIGQMGD